MQDLIERYLEKSMENHGSPYSAGVYEAMRYSLLDGGKRVRPTLAVMFCKLCGGRAENALPFACAVEMVHTYSLIHDDMPCMDNDDMRRGKPANHIVYGEDMALLAGDGLLTMAFELCLSDDAVKAAGYENALKAALNLARLAGAEGMVGGQCIDLKTGGKAASADELTDMVMGKTVRLLEAACVMGAIAAGADDETVDMARRYAEGIGMAFQIRDDILDVTGDAKVLGKNTGIDKQNDRCNFVTLMGLSGAERMVAEYTEKAVNAVREIVGESGELVDFALQLSTRVN